ncbi:AglZ/HisF2 family acetamidino modification protein [Alphaproteobacteria bacterium]|mgnify:FL=1|nr:AglZ/HisF2 family acetamidino modification protein [Alphaproteobacteria bacterium]
MLKSRIIPCLLLKNSGLVKTTKFKDAKYIGDPINAVKIFNEKEADELILLDIDATVLKQNPNYKLISYIAQESRMPLCYGGGIKNVEQIEKIICLGVEKVALSSGVILDKKLVYNSAKKFGSQSIVVVMDIKKTGILGRPEIVIENGKVRTKYNPVEFAKLVEGNGAGEIVINNVDKDGDMKGYDISLIESIRNSVNIPITALGGAGCLDDIKKLINRIGIIGAAAGSLFVFKGKYKAVLINYPDRVQKEFLLNCEKK